MFYSLNPEQDASDYINSLDKIKHSVICRCSACNDGIIETEVGCLKDEELNKYCSVCVKSNKHVLFIKNNYDFLEPNELDLLLKSLTVFKTL